MAGRCQECPLSRNPPPALPTAFRAGALAAIGTWTLVALPALVGWVSSPESTVAWWSGLAVGSALWFLGHGQSIGGPAQSGSITQLLLFVGFVLVCWRSARRLVAIERGYVRSAEWETRLWTGVVPGYLVGYGAAAAVFALLTLAGPVHPGGVAVIGALLVPSLGLAIVLLAPGRLTTPATVTRGLARAPGWLPVAVGGAWRAAVLLFAVGAALVVARVLGTLGTVVGIHGQYDAGVVAGAVLVVAQLAFLGNLAAWGLAFLAGPGFQVAVGGLISPAAAHPGLMPLVPVLGALPEDATYPWTMWLVLAVPVAVGALLGRWVERAAGDLPLAPRCLATGVAAFGAVMLVAGATALGNGAIGTERLAAVGVQVPALLWSLLLELVVGAGLWVAGRAAWQRRKRSRERDADRESTGADRARAT
jgi:hypothetical protein